MPLTLVKHRFAELEVGARFRLSRYHETNQLRDLDTPGVRVYEKTSAKKARRRYANSKAQLISARARVWPV